MGLVLLRDRSRDLTFRRHFILGSSHPLSDWLENQAQQQRMQEYFVVVISWLIVLLFVALPYRGSSILRFALI